MVLLTDALTSAPGTGFPPSFTVCKCYVAPVTAAILPRRLCFVGKPVGSPGALERSLWGVLFLSLSDRLTGVREDERKL